MSELKTTQQLHADNDISLAWDEYEKCGEVGNYAENLLHAAEFYQTEAKTKEQENQRLTAIAAKHATRADDLWDALERICSYLSEDGLITTGLAKEIVNAQRVLDKSRTEAEQDDA